MKFPVSLSGRIGLVIAFMGLAMILVSILPIEPMPAFSSWESAELPPQFYELLRWPYTPTITPTTIVNLTGNANGPLRIYLLAVDVNEFISWMAIRAPGLSTHTGNMTLLIEYVAAHPYNISAVFEASVGGTYAFSYVPETVQFLTVVLANPSEEVVRFDITYELRLIFGSLTRTREIGGYMMVGGLMLASPWLVRNAKEIGTKYKKKNASVDESQRAPFG